MSASERAGLALRLSAVPMVVVLMALGASVRTAAGAGADQSQLIAQSFLPGDGFLAGWKTSGKPRTFISQDLFNHIDGGAELFLEFGFARLRVQAYTDGASELSAAVYEMESATSALGIYLMKMGKETPFADVAARNSSETAQLNIVKGRYFVQIDNFDEKPAPRAAAVALANAVLALIPEEKPEPVLDLLPAGKRVAASERLVRGPYGLQPYYTFGEGDILRLGGRIFAALAEYEAADGSRFTRLIVPCADAAAAAAALENLGANLDPYLKRLETKPGRLAFIDFEKKYGAAELRGNILDIRFKLTTLD